MSAGSSVVEVCRECKISSLEACGKCEKIKALQRETTDLIAEIDHNIKVTEELFGPYFPASLLLSNKDLTEYVVGEAF